MPLQLLVIEVRVRGISGHLDHPIWHHYHRIYYHKAKFPVARCSILITLQVVRIGDTAPKKKNICDAALFAGCPPSLSEIIRPHHLRHFP